MALPPASSTATPASEAFLDCETTNPRLPEAAGLVRHQFWVVWEPSVKSMRVSSPTYLGGIIRKSGSAVTAVHIQDVPRHPIAFIRGKVESGARHGIDIAIGMRWNAIEVALLSARSVVADAGLDWTRGDRVDHDPLT